MQNILITPKAVLVVLVFVIAVNVPLYFYVYQERLSTAQGEGPVAGEASPRGVLQHESTSVVKLTMVPLRQQAVPDVPERTDATGASPVTEQDR